MKRTIQVLGFLLAALTTCMVAADKTRLSKDERTKVQSLLTAFSSAKTLNESSAAVKEILALGAPAAQLLNAKVKKVRSSNQNRYLSNYRKAVTKATADLTRKNLAEVTALRKTLAALREKGQNLTKNDVVKTGDPALERLMALVFVSHDAVIKKDPSLSALRDQLLVVGEWESNCREAMQASDSSNRPKKESVQVEQTSYTVLLKRLELLARAELTVGKRGRSVLIANERVADDIDGLEALGILHLNVMRMVVGLKPLKIDTRLCAAARDHSHDMLTKKFFAHESPVPGKKRFTDRAKRFKTNASGENIAYGNADPVATNMQWWHSPGHHVNMMRERFKGMGLGRSDKHWTQMFR